MLLLTLRTLFMKTHCVIMKQLHYNLIECNTRQVCLLLSVSLKLPYCWSYSILNRLFIYTLGQ